MANHNAVVLWERQDAAFSDNKYSRAHRWLFDGGLEIPASSSPHVVPIPLSDPANVDPEEAFIAAISSCHMLFFLSLAANKGLVIDRYEDRASAKLGRIGQERYAVTHVTLDPAIVFSGERLPTDADVAELHHESHERCFIANAVKAEIAIKGSWTAVARA